MTPTRYLSAKEVATILNISVKTVYKKLDCIPGYFNLGGMHFFDEDEFRSGLKSLATQKKQTLPFQSNRANVKDIHGLLK
ncbi:MAG: helix-turn-helix domain-containing protein [Ignavibacteria bacterium]|nr:helix-turn-helix domain-containing protein [Ignavibacteria bacterium]